MTDITGDDRHDDIPRGVPGARDAAEAPETLDAAGVPDARDAAAAPETLDAAAAPETLDAEPDILDVYADYLDRGEQPPAELIDASPENQLAWAALLRVRDAAGSLVDLEAEAAENPFATGWVESILANVQREVRSGRSIPLTHPSPRAKLTVTEAAVLGLVRAAGDSVDGVLIGRCVLDGDVEQPGAPVRVRVEASVFWGESIPERAEVLRAAIAHTLLEHTELTVESIDVTVTDVHLRRQTPSDGDGLAATAGAPAGPGDDGPSSDQVDDGSAR